MTMPIAVCTFDIKISYYIATSLSHRSYYKVIKFEFTVNSGIYMATVQTSGDDIGKVYYCIHFKLNYIRVILNQFNIEVKLIFQIVETLEIKWVNTKS